MTDVITRSMLAEHVGGDSYRTLGRRHGFSHEKARRLVLQQGSELIRDLECDLITATRGEDEWPTCLIPYQPRSDWRNAILMFDWCVSSLRDRGFEIEVRTRPTKVGVCFMLTTRRT